MQSEEDYNFKSVIDNTAKHISEGVFKNCKLSSGNEENFERSEFGAVRSTDADDIRYDLISHIGLRRLALRYALGSKKYGDHNWLKGFKASSTIKHLLKHFWMWFSGDRSDDHLAAVAWGIFTLMHFEETRPELIDVPVTLENVLAEEEAKKKKENEDKAIDRYRICKEDKSFSEST